MAVLNYFLTKVFGSENERTLKKIIPLAQHISSLEPEVEKLSDEQLRLKTQQFQEKLAQGATEELSRSLEKFPGASRRCAISTFS
jgi:preprotein translocase subunit SecA